MVIYSLVGKGILKGKINSYFITDKSGKLSMISVDKAIELTEKGLILNWSVITDENGEKHLFSKEYNINELQTMVKEQEKVRIINKLVSDNKVIGYSCIDANGIKHNYTKDKVWQLAKQGIIEKVRANKYNGQRVLISEGSFLRKLESIEISDKTKE